MLASLLVFSVLRTAVSLIGTSLSVCFVHWFDHVLGAVVHWMHEGHPPAPVSSLVVPLLRLLLEPLFPSCSGLEGLRPSRTSLFQHGIHIAQLVTQLMRRQQPHRTTRPRPRPRPRPRHDTTPHDTTPHHTTPPPRPSGQHLDSSQWSVSVLLGGALPLSGSCPLGWGTALATVTTSPIFQWCVFFISLLYLFGRIDLTLFSRVWFLVFLYRWVC